MAKKLDENLNCFRKWGENDFASQTQPVAHDNLFSDWLRRIPRWTTDLLTDMQPDDLRDME